MSTPAIPTTGLRHVALNVADVATSVAFYTGLFGMRVVWQPDDQNAYLSSGCDNLALHRAASDPSTAGQRLDHFGFVVAQPSDVDRAAEVLNARPDPHPCRTAHPPGRQPVSVLHRPGRQPDPDSL